MSPSNSEENEDEFFTPTKQGGQVLAALNMQSKVDFNDFKGVVMGVVPEPVEKPDLNPMPGRVVVELVDRIEFVPGTTMAVDNRYQYQPYIGRIVAIGSASNAEQQPLRAELLARQDRGERMITLMANGVEYGSKEAYDLVASRPDGTHWQPFKWLSKLRVFRIEDFGCTLKGGDELGGSAE